MPFHRGSKAGSCSLLEPSGAAVIHRAPICKCDVVILKIPLIIAPFFSSIFLTEWRDNDSCTNLHKFQETFGSSSKELFS